MTGVDIIGEILLGSSEFLARVPAIQIKAGLLPDGTPLPAVLVRTVSVVDRQPLKRVGVVRRTDRTAVTVRAKSYQDQVAIMALAKRICAGRIGTFASATGVSIFTAGTGPDVLGPANSFEQTQDFKVSFDEPV